MVLKEKNIQRSGGDQIFFIFVMYILINFER